VIDFFSAEDLRTIVDHLKSKEAKSGDHLLNAHIARGAEPIKPAPSVMLQRKAEDKKIEEAAEALGVKIREKGDDESDVEDDNKDTATVSTIGEVIAETPEDDRSKEEIDEDLYSVKNFSV
jgi:hypothetical protein